ncbi:sulfotransferase family protein [Phenylobacterium sp.]|uniref:sulfotransferase family protein n=1 Tax=Phenylobacterium sp. TaxID=1871053 RepID=UPI002FC7DEDA
MARPTVGKSKADRAAYLVLGMHRSGTSAVTQLLALAGAELPQNVMPGDEHNAKGYFEPWKIAVFNDERLRAGGGAWDDVFAFPYQPLPGPQEAEWAAKALALYDAEFGEAWFPLLKDPRVSVLAPLWRATLKARNMPARAVMPVRHPLSVAKSLMRRDGFPVEKSVLLWVTYMLAAELYSRDMPRAFVGYDRLLADWRAEVTRIEAAHGAALPRLSERAASEIDAFLTTDLRHDAGGGDLSAIPLVGPLAQRAYDWFEAAARDAPRDSEALDQVAVEVADMKAQMGVFVSPAARALDLARADLVEARGLRAMDLRYISTLEGQVARLRSELSTIEAMVDTMIAGR